MISSKIKKLTLAASVAMATTSSSAYATTISVGVAPSFAEALIDLAGAFQEYYITHGNLNYNVVVTVDSTANLKSEIINGGPSGPFDLLLSPDNLALFDLALKQPSLVVGQPFQYATDSLMLYSKSQDISAGLPSSLTQDFVIADPLKDAYGRAAAQVLATTPGIVTAFRQGHIKTRDDIGTTFAAVDGGSYAYGLVAKSQICQYNNSSEYYVDGTYHHEYSPTNSAHPYIPISLNGIKIALTRATDKETELADFVNFLTGQGATAGTSVIKQYCYKVS
jgi:molybdate transport system substrate-binding protein